ncbi:hypothetical protein AX16_006018 [Volvariella volvacea WC 439]|nr:hypothetical protein AX16_006018 [Volvariella volvacea WC 439]
MPNTLPLRLENDDDNSHPCSFHGGVDNQLDWLNFSNIQSRRTVSSIVADDQPTSFCYPGFTEIHPRNPTTHHIATHASLHAIQPSETHARTITQRLGLKSIKTTWLWFSLVLIQCLISSCAVFAVPLAGSGIYKRLSIAMRDSNDYANSLSGDSAATNGFATKRTISRGVGSWLESRQFASGNSGSNDGNSSSGVPPQLWIPIIIVALLVLATAIITWSKRTLRRSIANLSGGTTGQDNVRNVTAEQLANGGGNGSSTSNVGPDGRPRRSRRPRRTPSQVSTKSLPAYMREPGEEEVVIYRAPEDEASATTSRSTLRTIDEANNSSHSRNDSMTYPRMPNMPNTLPLLQDDSSMDLSRPPGMDGPRASMDTLDGDSSGDTTSLIRARSNSSSGPDARGEAPPYFEVVDTGADSTQIQRSAPNSPSGSPPAESTTQLERSTSPTTPSPTTPPPTDTRRRSGIRSLFGGLPGIGSSSHRPQASQSSHARVGSTASATSSVLSASPSNTPSAINGAAGRPGRHRPNQSSTSLISVSAFRNTFTNNSSSRVNNQLSSPSAISLNSISSPLTHTLVKSEFTYPKSGPTPDQMKLLASRDSIVRFGIPYGPDAIAAYASRVDLPSAPPPTFDFGASGSTDPGSSSGAGLSVPSPARPHARSMSSASSPLSNAHDPPSRSNTQSGAHSRSHSQSEVQMPTHSTQDNTQNTQPPTASTSSSFGYRMPAESRGSSYSLHSFATAVESLPPGGRNTAMSGRTGTVPDMGTGSSSSASSSTGRGMDGFDEFGQYQDAIQGEGGVSVNGGGKATVNGDDDNGSTKFPASLADTLSYTPTMTSAVSQHAREDTDRTVMGA